MDDNAKFRFKFHALLKEYSEIRHESTTYEILKSVCIMLSVLTYVILFISAVSFNQYILLFISPVVSIFFVLLTLAMQAYSTSLGLRASQIEDLLKNMIGEPTIQFEATTGIFMTSSGDVLTTQVGRYWFLISSLVIVAGVAPVSIGLFYGLQKFYELSYSSPILAGLIVGLNIFVGSSTVYMGYKFFFKRGWEKLKVSL